MCNTLLAQSAKNVALPPLPIRPITPDPDRDPPPPKLDDAARALAAENIRLARKFASLARRRFPKLDDQEIESACMMGLCKAAAAFDPSLGFKFSSLAYALMRGEVQRCMRRRRQVAFTDLLDDEARYIANPIDHREGTAFEAAQRADSIEWLRAGLGQLDERQRYVITRLALEGAGYREITRELAEIEGREAPMTRERVRQIAMNAAHRLACKLGVPFEARPRRSKARSPKPPEGYIPISDIPRMVPPNRDGRPIILQTVEEWTRPKPNRPALRSVKFGQKRYTTREDLRRFLEARKAASPRSSRLLPPPPDPRA